MAAQDQAIRTNWIRHNIDKEGISPSCRLCGERDETVSHIDQNVRSWLRTIIKKQGMTKLLQSFTGRCAKYMDFPPLQRAMNIS